MRVAIIGAGLTGLTAASALRDAELAVVVFDKGRGLGGRLSTRRSRSGCQFDHGAQYLSGTDASYQAFLGQLVDDGVAKTWLSDDDAFRVVGLPGMSGIATHLARGIEVRTSIEITELRKSEAGWTVGGEHFDRVICTIPAPQAQRLVPAKQIQEGLSAVRMEPNLTLMVAFSEDQDAPFQTRRDAEQDIAWIALDSSKPDRAGPQCWVAQASLDWSHAHLELEKEDMAKLMLPLVCDALDVEPSSAIYAAAHRWRYAFASKPLGAPFLGSDGLFVGGDWALSSRAEGAWLSGCAMAQAVLSSR